MNSVFFVACSFSKRAVASVRCNERLLKPHATVSGALYSIFYVTVLGLCAGCHTSDVPNAMAASATVVIAPPVVSSYVLAHEGSALAQGSSIAVGARTQWYSEKLTMSELWQKSMMHGQKFHEPWKYMGTKNGEHYLALYPFLGYREIYRIDEAQYEVEDPFELTSKSYKWRDVFKYSYSGIEQMLVIEPLLLEGLDLGEGGGVVEVGGGGGITIINANLEDAFMMEVPILEGE